MGNNTQTRAIEIVSKAAKQQKIDFLLIGAYARNLFLMGKPTVPNTALDLRCRYSMSSAELDGISGAGSNID